MKLLKHGCFLACLAIPHFGLAQESTEAEGATTPSSDTGAEATPAETPEPIPGETSTPAGDMQKGLLGDFRVGPNLSVGLPHLLNYGLDVMYKRDFSAGFSTGSFSQDMDKAKIELTNWDFRLRWHPFAGSFFVGGAYGKQNLAGEASEDIEFDSNGLALVVPTTLRVQFNTTYFTPHLGWMGIWDSGFMMGFEIGAQIPLDNTSKLQVAFKNVAPSQEEQVKQTKEYKDLQKSVDDAGKLLGESVFPYITILKLGWLF